jgi:hypothetical protein
MKKHLGIIVNSTIISLCVLSMLNESRFEMMLVYQWSMLIHLHVPDDDEETTGHERPDAAVGGR